MNSKEHYDKAEDLLGQAARAFDFDHIQALAQRAQAHALLALIKAGMTIADQRIAEPGDVWEIWNQGLE